MKDKIRNYLSQHSPQPIASSQHELAYTFRKQIRRTLGSEDQLDDNTWNLSMTRVQPIRTPLKSKADLLDYNALIDENQRLKQQIRTLKQLLVDGTKLTKSYQTLEGTLKFRKDEKAEQITKLKKIIQKSLHSFKQLQGQIKRLNEQLELGSKNYSMLQKKYKFLEFQKQQLDRKIASMSVIHKQEMQICNDRIRRLEMRTQQLLQMIENDQHNWSLHTQQLYNLKRFYSKGTSK